jgi:hypothetical protein
MTGVTGWWLAKPCSHVGIVWTGTNALLGYGRKATKNVNPAAASGLRASRPIAADSHEMANMNASSTPAAATHWVNVALGRKPISQRHPEHDHGRDDVAGHAGGDVAGEHGGAADVHGAEPVDDAALSGPGPR